MIAVGRISELAADCAMKVVRLFRMSMSSALGGGVTRQAGRHTLAPERRCLTRCRRMERAGRNDLGE